MTCAAGVLDCALLPAGSSEICAEYDGAYRVFAHDGGTLALGAGTCLASVLGVALDLEQVMRAFDM